MKEFIGVLLMSLGFATLFVVVITFGGRKR